MRARQRLRDRQVLAPADSVLRRVLGSARQAARAAMVERMEGDSFRDAARAPGRACRYGETTGSAR